MYRLFGTRGSGSAIVEIALGLCQVPCTTVEASSWEASPGADELERLNPLKQIPTLQLPDGSILTESAAILIHLGLEHPLSGLLPVQSAARAQVIRGLVYIAANCYSAIGVLDYPERWICRAEAADMARVREAALQRLHLNWEVFAEQFPAQPWLGGANFGALDLYAAVVSRWSGARAYLRQAQPGFFLLLERIDRQPQVAEVLTRHWPE